MKNAMHYVLGLANIKILGTICQRYFPPKMNFYFSKHAISCFHVIPPLTNVLKAKFFSKTIDIVSE